MQPYNAQKDYSYQTFGFDVNQKTVYDGNSSEPSSSLFIHGNSFREDICDGFHRMNSLYGASGAIRCIYVEGNQVLNQNSDDKKMRGMYLVALHPRNSHSSVFSSESIVFVVENFFTNAKDNSNEGTHVRQMLLALLHRLSQGGSWISRTLLFVLPDQRSQTWADSEETIHSFLDLYASGQLQLMPDVSVKAIRQAFVIRMKEIEEKSTNREKVENLTDNDSGKESKFKKMSRDRDYWGIYVQGRHGVLPNLDFVSIIFEALRIRSKSPVYVHPYFNFHDLVQLVKDKWKLSRSHTSYLSDLMGMIGFIRTMAVGP